MAKIIGIDLGTTKSVAAVVLGNEVHVIPSADGGYACPSVVAFSNPGAPLVGSLARQQMIVQPANTITSIKRLMGRRLAELDQNEFMAFYQLASGPAGEVLVDIPATKRLYGPEEISAQILARLKADAEAYLNQPVEQVVITVPAYFNERQRQATRAAAQIAGLEVVRLLNEPTAAALAYQLGQPGRETVMVFDLGGGTFDVSILEVGPEMVEVKATRGDTRLGGNDWDALIVRHLLEAYQRSRGRALDPDPEQLARFWAEAEKAKVALSNWPETEINLPAHPVDSQDGQSFQVCLTRREFEARAQELLSRLEQALQAVLDDAGLSVDQLDRVILVGGASRMPMIKERIQAWTGQLPHQGIHPDQAVAIGAALQAAAIDGHIGPVRLLDVTPLSLGVETQGDMMTVLIERNTTIPVRVTRIFSTAEDNQVGVDIHVLQGEQPRASQNMTLGRFRLDGLPHAPRGVLQIEVCFDLDANGILNVSARDLESGQQQQVTLLAPNNLSAIEIESLFNATQ